jgi:Spy/CpxP family protein refolding chaperone
MRNRERVLQSLENVYRAAFVSAEEAGDSSAMARLDLEYQRDQLHLEVLLDIRELLTPEQPDQTTARLEKAHQLRRLTKLRP